jgi:Amt family ammonium transporter
VVQQAYSGAFYGNWHQLWVQLIAVGATIIYSGLGTFIIFKVTELIIAVRANDKHEAIGLDETQHGETAYTSFE